MSTAVGIGAVALALAPLGSASAAADSQGVYADLNGDGTPDKVTLFGAGEFQQVLRVEVQGKVVEATVPWNGWQTLPIQPTDINRDGRAELVIHEAAGANTDTFGVWDYSDSTGLREISTGDGQPLKLYEGGGATARAGYECASRYPYGYVLITVSMRQQQFEPPAFGGEYAFYRVKDGVATKVMSNQLSGISPEDPLLDPNPWTC